MRISPVLILAGLVTGLLHAGCSEADDAPAFDHLILLVPDLDAYSARFAAETGVTPTQGGVHPHTGTANLLVALGPRSYLEILGPNPAQGSLSGMASLLSRVSGPRVGWYAVAADSIERIAGILDGEDLTVMGPEPGSRETPAGDVLHWSTVFATGHEFGDQLPFFIDWLDSPHPASTSAEGISVDRFVAIHPEASRLEQLYEKLGVSVEVVAGSPAGYELTLRTPKGPVTFDARAPEAFFMPLYAPAPDDAPH